MILTKIKKINKRTHKNKKFNSTPIIVFTYYFDHISYYCCIFLLCPVSIFPWYQLKYTKFRNGGLVGGFVISSDGYFFFSFFFFLFFFDARGDFHNIVFLLEIFMSSEIVNCLSFWPLNGGNLAINHLLLWQLTGGGRWPVIRGKIIG